MLKLTQMSVTETAAMAAIAEANPGALRMGKFLNGFRMTMARGVLEMTERMTTVGDEAKGAIAAAMASQRSGTAESFSAEHDSSMNKPVTVSADRS